MDYKRVSSEKMGSFSHLLQMIIAIFISILFIIPAKNTEKHRRIIDWEVAKELPWGVLILFGGGLALAKGVS